MNPYVNDFSTSVQKYYKEGLSWSEMWLKFGQDRYNYDKEHHMSKKVRQLDMNGNVIAEYFSFAQAARAVGLKSYTSISNAAKNDKLTAKGYKWELVE